MLTHTTRLFAVLLFVFCLMNFKLNFRLFGNAPHTIQHSEERHMQRDKKKMETMEGKREGEEQTGRKELKKSGGEGKRCSSTILVPEDTWCNRKTR